MATMPLNLWQQLHPKHFFLETWQALDHESQTTRHQSPSTYDHRPWMALVVGTLCLVLIEYVGYPSHFRSVVQRFQGVAEIQHSPWWELYQFAWWSGWRWLGFFLLPALSLRIMGQSLRDHGLRSGSISQHLGIYLLCYAAVALGILVVAQSSSFLSYYPFYRYASRSWVDLIAWELLYALQFFSLEFFFRGYWLNACRQRLGSYAIIVTVVPYCMIHFGKPVLETIAAIPAGIVLGTLALKTRSIWGGVVLHIAVAVTMDITALLLKEQLPTRWLF